VVSNLEAREIANFCELFTDLQVSFFRKLAALQSLDRSDFDAALQAMTMAISEDDTHRLLAARGAFLSAGFQQLDNFYLCSVLSGLIPAGQRLAHRVARHAAYDPRDTLRYHQALLDAITGHDTSRVEELVRAYNRREAKLALGCSEHAQPRSGAAVEKLQVFSARGGRK